MKFKRKNMTRNQRTIRAETLAGILDVFKISTMTLLRWRRRGLPCSVRHGRHYFSAGEVAAWLREHPNLNHGKGRPRPELSADELRDKQEIENVTRFLEAHKEFKSLTVMDFFPIEDEAEKLTTPRRRLSPRPV
jgi:phage terminase Nu1 subunit (DNA packaging protein)